MKDMEHPCATEFMPRFSGGHKHGQGTLDAGPAFAQIGKKHPVVMVNPPVHRRSADSHELPLSSALSCYNSSERRSRQEQRGQGGHQAEDVPAHSLTLGAFGHAVGRHTPIMSNRNCHLDGTGSSRS